VPDSLLAILKVVFLGLLYLFFLRVLRAVWIELREPKTVQVAAVPPASAPAPAPRRRRERSKADSLRLVVVEPAERRGQAFELSEELTVGRAPGCGVTLPEDTFVSQLHARVFRRDGALYVEDLGSTNGTLLNHQAVTTPVPLRKGDRLQVGKTVLGVEK
jgi:hypothetical protein